MNARTAATINDLIEMNREIAALIRAGVPLELGLRSIAGERQTRFDRLAERMAQHLSAGHSLADAFAQETGSMSPVYAAVVDAGSQSGQLPAALDSVARSARIFQDIRQRLGLAVIYPLTCLVVALLLAAGVITLFVPPYQALLDNLRLAPDGPVRVMFSLHRSMPIWLVQVPLATLGLIVAAYILRFVPRYSPWRWMTSLTWLPGYGRIQHSLRRSQFLELLALQTSFGIPLEQAFPRAASVTEEPVLQSDAKRVSAALLSGRSLSDALAEATAISASWKWVLVTSHEAGLLPVAIRQLADQMWQRATRQAAWFSFVMPTTLALSSSALIVIVYALIVLLPVISLWKGLGHE